MKAPTSFVGRWVAGISPAFDKLAGTDSADDIHALEKQLFANLENLKGFPFIANYGTR